MKNFNRSDLMFSLCGLNCALCSMKLDNYCPGCGGGEGNQSCAIAKCSLQRGVEYCYQCESFPCEEYDGIEEYDSFITHRNQLRDMDKMKHIGVEQYHAELREKAQMLKYFLINCNDGRRKSFYCVAVNLLELQECRDVFAQVSAKIAADETLSLKERASFAAGLFQEIADRHKIPLKLNRKPSKKK